MKSHLIAAALVSGFLAAPVGAQTGTADGNVPLGEQPPASALETSPGLTAAQEADVAVGGAPVDAGGGQVLVEIDEVPNLDGRGGEARRRIALMQTTLLNRFSQLGFSDVTDFRREGETYVAEAVTAQGNEVTVTIDPLSGSIVAR